MLLQCRSDTELYSGPFPVYRMRKAAEENKSSAKSSEPSFWGKRCFLSWADRLFSRFWNPLSSWLVLDPALFHDFRLPENLVLLFTRELLQTDRIWTTPVTPPTPSQRCREQPVFQGKKNVAPRARWKRIRKQGKNLQNNGWRTTESGHAEILQHVILLFKARLQ